MPPTFLLQEVVCEPVLPILTEQFMPTENNELLERCSDTISIPSLKPNPGLQMKFSEMNLEV